MDLAEQLRILEEAQRDPARLALATIDIAHGNLPAAEREELKDALAAAAVPHWVDADFLAALLGCPRERAAGLAMQLRHLNVIERFPARGEDALNVHEASRKALRKQLRTEQRDRFARLSARAHEFVGGATAFHLRIERLYHLFAFDMDAAAAECGRLDHDASAVESPESWAALARLLSELLAENWLTGRAFLEATLSVNECRMASNESAGVRESAEAALKLATDLGEDRLAARARILLGDLLRLRGDLEGALRAFENSEELMRRYTARFPDDPGLQRELSASINRLGDIYALQQQFTEASEIYRRSFEIASASAERYPDDVGCQRQLSITHSRLGDVLSENKLWYDALAEYKQSLAIAERLTQESPQHSGWQRVLGVAHSRLGDVFVALERFDDAISAFKKNFDIAENLAALEPNNMLAQRELAVARTKFADMLARNGRSEEALGDYYESLEAHKALVAHDPTNADWQRELGLALFSIGHALAALNRRDEALKYLHAAEAQSRSAVAMAPGIAEWRRDIELTRSWITELEGAADDAPG